MNVTSSQELRELDPKFLEAIHGILEMIKLWFPLYETKIAGVISLVVEGFKATSTVYGVDDANKWADGFEFPPNLGTRDYEDLQQHRGDLEALVAYRQAAVAESRFNASRLADVVSADDPDLTYLQSLVGGWRS